MQYKGIKNRIFAKLLIVSVGITTSYPAFSVPGIPNQAIKNALPGSTEPGVITNMHSNQASQTPGSLPAVRPLLQRNPPL